MFPFSFLAQEFETANRIEVIAGTGDALRRRFQEFKLVLGLSTVSSRLSLSAVLT
jgi:hypothetical protein